MDRGVQMVSERFGLKKEAHIVSDGTTVVVC